MTCATPEPAIAAGEDPRRYAHLLAAVYDATMSGARGPARPRALIAASWDRVRGLGVDPDRPAPRRPVRDLDALRDASGLRTVIDDITGGLGCIIDGGESIVVVADSSGRVLWRSGDRRLLTRAEGIGFAEGASWLEGEVGTNAIGTALASRRAVQIFSAEHYVRSHHAWTCAAAPIRDPRTGRPLGVVDVSGPAATVHPTTLGLVGAVALLAETRLQAAHSQSLDRVRTVAAPVLARLSGPALAVDGHGWVAAASDLPAPTRVALPLDLTPGRRQVADLGVCDVEAIPGGWLMRVADTEPQTSTALLDLTCPTPIIDTDGPLGRLRRDVSARHAQILAELADAPAGRSAAQLAAALFGDASKTVTIRAEISRLRRAHPGLITGSPYRLATPLTVRTGLV